MSKRRAGRRSAWIAAIALFAMLPFGGAASAHAYSAGYSTLTIAKSEIRLEYAIDELSVIEWAGGDANDDKMLDQAEFEAVKDSFAAILEKHLTLKTGGTELPWSSIENYRLERKGDASDVILDLVYPALSEDGTISLSDKLYVDDQKTNYVDLLTVNYGSNQSTAALSGKDRAWSLRMTDEEYASLPSDLQQQTTQSPEQADSDAAANDPAPEEDAAAHGTGSVTSGWFSFFKLGMNHILGGYDHLLFLFSLIIARQTFKQYAAMITAFTVAHSITLTLTVLGWISVPGSIVEPLIALSICYVAVDNMLRANVRYRWVLTFLFGLVHGMGFADILVEMNLPRASLGVDLASFNIGIEAVQLGLIAVCLPLLYALHRYRHEKRIVYAASSLALLLGGIWLFERTFG
ncbi:HupE/UreJ family protein [Cohnella sp. GCM10020058]|uniref:HupE/UreJ family protein n=1 Tax=Cohnella sp. GCM10020058 TaxID=3317330 RepID=UPI00362B2B98